MSPWIMNAMNWSWSFSRRHLPHLPKKYLNVRNSVIKCAFEQQSLNESLGKNLSWGKQNLGSLGCTFKGIALRVVGNLQSCSFNLIRLNHLQIPWMAEAQFSPLYIYLHYSNAHSPICTQVCMHTPGGKLLRMRLLKSTSIQTVQRRWPIKD